MGGDLFDAILSSHVPLRTVFSGSIIFLKDESLSAGFAEDASDGFGGDRFTNAGDVLPNKSPAMNHRVTLLQIHIIKPCCLDPFTHLKNPKFGLSQI